LLYKFFGRFLWAVNRNFLGFCLNNLGYKPGYVWIILAGKKTPAAIACFLPFGSNLI